MAALQAQQAQLPRRIIKVGTMQGPVGFMAR